MALVLLAAGRWPVREEMDADPRERTRITLTSKYDLDETLRQVERSARRSGLPVVARAAPKSQAGAHAQAAGAPADAAEVAHVLVLGDADGRTPVLQAEGSPSPELPWQVVVRQHLDGHTEVSIPNPRKMAVPDEVQPELLERVTALPAVLKSAIT